MASDYFLKIEGVDGESTDATHKGEIEILSYSWSENQSGTHASSAGGGGGAGKVAMQDFHFNMFVNKASPKLMLACATGDHLKTAKLTVRKAGGDQQEFMTITFSDILVSAYSTGGASGGDSVPTESISLNFSKVEFEYKPQKPDGTLDSPVKTGYNLATNKKI
jgi:type VI secretion system secreted protein Hcp